MKGHIAFAVCAASLASSAVQAQASAADECLPLEKAEQRLACYDKHLGYKPKDEPKPEVRPAIRWKVRDSGTVSPVGLADVGTKAAQFQYGHDGDKDFSKVSVAVVGVFRAINQPGPLEGWEPFVGATVNRDTSGKTPKDQRQVFVGITGEVGTPSPTGLAALPTLRLGYKDDLKSHVSGGWANLHVDVIYLPLVASPQRKGTTSGLLVPYFGMYSAGTHTSPQAATDGTYYGAYAGGKAEFQLGAIADRLSLSISGQAYRDANAPDGGAKRTLRFGSVAFKYDLVDPSTKKGWVPSISLSWQKGTEPITGEGPGEKWLLGLSVKYD